MTKVRPDAIVGSALWAAYGDALGFITELADAKMLQRRLRKNDKVSVLVPWKRRVGGRFGVELTLPRGCYSDDTQLRLATSRSIQKTGEFDVEAFSKVELPVWLSYALGGGRGTKAAASSLIRRDTRWFSNFYADNSAHYITSGGNGAAMRIQPHVWAARHVSRPETYLVDVLRNAISTHGHPRALAGAVLHALCLGQILQTGQPLSIFDLIDLCSWLKDIPELISTDPDLADFWVPKWEEFSDVEIKFAFDEVYFEVLQEIEKMAKWWDNCEEKSYESVVSLLNLSDPNSRGSGTKTVLAAAAISMLSQNRTAQELLIDTANALGTDTDSIASMAGALLGVVHGPTVPEKPQDADLIRSDALRLHRISDRENVENFRYPSLLTWQPPKAAVDSVVLDNGRQHLVGFGEIRPISPPLPASNTRDDFVFQWVQTKFGQSLLVKRRNTINSHPFESTTAVPERNNELQPEALKLAINNSVSETVSRENRDVDVLSDEAIHSGFDPLLIGSHILELIDDSEAVEKVIAYTAIIAKAKITRARRERNEQ